MAVRRLSLAVRYLAVAAVGLLPAATLQAAQKIADIQVAGNQTVKAEVIVQVVSPIAKAGGEVERVDVLLPRIRQEVLRLGYFDDVGVATTSTAAGVVITITVKERLRVSKVVFVGNTVIASDELMKLVRTRPGLLLDGRILKRDAERIAEAYQEQGALAEVADPATNAHGEVTFAVAEVRIEAIRFSGLRIVTEKEAAELFAVKPGELLVGKQVSAAVGRLREAGWFSAVDVAVTAGKKDGGRDVTLVVTVTERPGVLPERIGAPAAAVDAAKLRADVSIVKLDIQYQAGVQVNDTLIYLEQDVSRALAEREQAARAAGAPATALYEWARMLAAVDRKSEATTQFRAAAAGLRKQLEQAPDNIELLLKLAECLGGCAQYEEALGVLRQTVKLAPARWEPRVQFARIAGEQILAAFGKAIAATPGTTRAVLRQSPPMRAVVEMMPWENTRKVILAALDTSAEPTPLVLVGREAAANLAESERLAPREPAVLRECFSAMLDGFFTALHVVGQDAEAWRVIDSDTRTFVTLVGTLIETDPGLALWSAFFESFQSVLSLAGRSGPPLSDEQVTVQFQALARRLTEIAAKWPRALRSSGSMLGILQFLANEQDLARATFEQAIAENPYERQNYNALLGLAYNAGDWAAMEKVVRRRLAANPAAEDYVLLGKVMDRQNRVPEVLGAFREAVARFPGDALGYVATAGWLVHLGTGDTEAETLLAKGLAVDPNNAYALAVRCALRLIQNKPQEAAAALTAALKLKPDEELANVLRERYFPPPPN